MTQSVENLNDSGGVERVGVGEDDVLLENVNDDLVENVGEACEVNSQASERQRKKQRKQLWDKVRNGVEIFYEILWDFLYIHSTKLTLLTVIVFGIMNVNLAHAIHVIFWILISPFMFYFGYERPFYKYMTVMSTLWCMVMVIATLIYQVMFGANVMQPGERDAIKTCNLSVPAYYNEFELRVNAAGEPEAKDLEYNKLNQHEPQTCLEAYTAE